MFKKNSMNEFQSLCPLTIFSKNQFTKGEDISGDGCNASVIRANIEGVSCIAKLYDYNDTGWEDEKEFLDDFLEVCETLMALKESPCIVHALGVVIYETWGNIQLYLLTEEKQAIDVDSYLQKDEFWTSSKKYYSPPYYYYDDCEKLYWSYKKKDEDKLKLIRSMVECVKELHDQDYIHLDIKLHNMVIENDNVYLIDYDSITCLENKKTTSIYCRCGTSGYCANEQWELHASKKTDIYSLGVCMVEVWCGSIWEDDYRDPERYRKQLLSCIRKIESREPTLGKIFRKCVSLQEKNRYKTDTLWKRINEDILIS
jgi:serine/threonine protein kinase